MTKINFEKNILHDVLRHAPLITRPVVHPPTRSRKYDEIAPVHPRTAVPDRRPPDTGYVLEGIINAV